MVCRSPYILSNLVQHSSSSNLVLKSGLYRSTVLTEKSNMRRIVIFANKGSPLDAWRPWLEQDFEVTFITSEEALLPLIQSWLPNILIYFSQPIDSDLIESIYSHTTAANFNLGLVIVAAQYDLREEIRAFQLNADHYILASTPSQSIKARIHSLVIKNERSRGQLLLDDSVLLPKNLVSLTKNLISLPKNSAPLQNNVLNSEKLFYKDLILLPEQNVIQYLDQYIRVTPTQFRILIALLKNTDKVLSREWIRLNVFKGANISLRSIDAHISKLKRAIPTLNTEIINVYGQGYICKSEKSRAS